ncbi:group I intron splicing factor [Schizosaccharomyces octosporus yFS286]|uniref:Group I intron splicing factor n=1 Tax=Schizosaccharomyces octosporus (strain yFS286) TaxID=483514 RepID=S9REQ8_SCHOY|nr:group I intron splicing factor [Schizosaccharomyces octosporus yFS286]EPX72549.1 group I intron splicing factor [Schizosaccharomyces octosporus yFS286]
MAFKWLVSQNTQNVAKVHLTLPTTLVIHRSYSHGSQWRPKSYGNLRFQRFASNVASLKAAQQELDQRIKQLEGNLETIRKNQLNKLHFPRFSEQDIEQALYSIEQQEESDSNSTTLNVQKSLPGAAFYLGPVLSKRLQLDHYENEVLNSLVVVEKDSQNLNLVGKSKGKLKAWNKKVLALLADPNCFQGVSKSQIENFVKIIPTTLKVGYMEQILKNLENSNLGVWHELCYQFMVACNGKRLFSKSLKLLEQYKKTDSNVHSDLCHAEAFALSRLGLYSELPKLINLYQTEVKEFEHSFFSLCLGSFCKAQMTSQAFSLFDFMKFVSVNTAPNENDYNSLIHLCAVQKKPEKALELYNDMTKRPINPLRPTELTINNLIHALSTQKIYHPLAFAYLSEFTKFGLAANAQTSYELLRLAAQSGNINALKNLYNQYWIDNPILPKICSVERLFNFAYKAYANTTTEESLVIPSLDRIRENAIRNLDEGERSPFGSRNISTKSDLFYAAVFTREYTKKYHPEIVTKTSLSFLNVFSTQQNLELFKGVYSTEFSQPDSSEKTQLENNFITQRNIIAYYFAIYVSLHCDNFVFGYSTWQEYYLHKDMGIIPPDLKGYEQKITTLMISLFSKHGYLELARKLLIASLNEGWEWTPRSLGYLRKLASLKKDQATVQLIDGITGTQILT